MAKSIITTVIIIPIQISVMAAIVTLLTTVQTTVALASTFVQEATHLPTTITTMTMSQT